MTPTASRRTPPRVSSPSGRATAHPRHTCWRLSLHVRVGLRLQLDWPTAAAPSLAVAASSAAGRQPAAPALAPELLHLHPNAAGRVPPDGSPARSAAATAEGPQRRHAVLPGCRAEVRTQRATEPQLGAAAAARRPPPLVQRELLQSHLHTCRHKTKSEIGSGFNGSATHVSIFGYFGYCKQAAARQCNKGKSLAATARGAAGPRLAAG